MKHRQMVKVMSVLTVFLASIMIALFHTNQVKAVSVSINGADASSAVLTDLNGKKIDHSAQIMDWQTVLVKYQWSIPNGVQISSGDSTTFTLPSNVKANANLQIPIKDNAGNSVGSFSISKGAQVGSLIFSREFSSETQNRQGSLQFYVCGSKVDDSDKNFSVNKYGWISGYDGQNVPSQLTWNIALNSAGQSLTNVTLTDVLGSGQKFVANSVVANTGYYSNGQFVSTGVIVPKVSISGNTMKLVFSKITTAVNLTYLANVAPDATAQNISWNNNVSMTCDQGNGVSTSSSHKIEWGGTGSGSGTVGKGDVILTDTDSQDGSPVVNASFDLYDSNDKLVKSNLVTDQKGQISLTGLTTGNYYFLQTKTPSNFTLNNNKFPFTIVNDKVATVSMTNIDPPTTQPTDPTDQNSADSPLITDPTDPDPDPVETTDSSSGQTVIPVDPSAPTSGVSESNVASAATPKLQNAIFVGDPILIGDPPEANVKPVYYASNNNDQYHSQVFPSRRSGKLPQTGNSKGDSFLQSVAGVFILFIIGSEYLLWKKSKG